MDFIFHGTDGGDKLVIGDFATDGYPLAYYEKYCVGASGHTSANALGKSSKVVGKCLAPKVGILSFQQMAVFKCLTSEGVNDRVGVIWSL